MTGCSGSGPVAGLAASIESRVTGRWLNEPARRPFDKASLAAGIDQTHARGPSFRDAEVGGGVAGPGRPDQAKQAASENGVSARRAQADMRT